MEKRLITHIKKLRMNYDNKPHTCDSCEETWEDNFWCTAYKNNYICRNCCPCAYGYSIPCTEQNKDEDEE